MTGASSGESPAGEGVPSAAEWRVREAQRRRGAERAMRGVFAGTLCLEALTVILVPRAVAWFGPGLTAVRLIVLLTLAALLVATAALLRRRWALRFGSVLQLAVLACGLLTWAMFALGVIFGLLWIYELRLRAELLTPRPPPA